jgi:hypothetical protein
MEAPRRIPAGTRVFTPAVGLALGCLMVWLVALVRFRAWFATDDHAVFQLGLERFWQGHVPMTGAYSRLGVHHPGPLREWIFAIAYRASGKRAAALPATALAWNVAALGTGLLAARASGGRRHLLAAATAAVVLAGGLGVDLHSPWNPFLAVLTGFAAFWCVVAAVRGAAWARPAALVWAALAAQLHAAAVPASAVAIGLVLVVWWRSVAARRRWEPVALLVVLWSGPLIDLRHGREANLVRIVTESDGARTGLAQAMRYVARLVTPWSLARGEFASATTASPPSLPLVVAVGLLTFVIVALGLAAFSRSVAASGEGDRVVSAAALGALVMALAAVALFVEPVYPYLFAPLAAALVAPMTALAAAVATWAARTRALTQRARHGVAAAGILSVALACLPGFVQIEAIQHSPLERGLRGAMQGRVTVGSDYDIEGFGLRTVTPGQVALYVHQAGGNPYSTLPSLDLPAPADAMPAFFVAAGEPLACLQDAVAPGAVVALEENTYTRAPIGVFVLNPGEAAAARVTCHLEGG